MRSSATITLFSEGTQSSRRPTAVVLSVLAHALGIGLVAAGLLLQPQFKERVITQRYTVRHLDLHMPEPEKPRPSQSEIAYPGPANPTPQKSESETPRPAVARQVAEVKPAPQTLMQPKLPPHMLTENIPLPTVVIWKTENQPLSKIVPPLPQKTQSATVKPAMNPPNEEVNLSDLGLKSSDLASKAQPILPSTSSPLVVLAPEPKQAPPSTTSVSTEQPTPAAVVSLSDLRKEGTVIIPNVNQTASANTSGIAAAGQPTDNAQANANGQAQTPGAGNKPGQTTSAAGTQMAANGGRPGTSATVRQSNGTDQANAMTADRIALPKDGQFGVVVVGSSLEELYPETAELWAGRLAYTVYLHVGLSRSWILQYSLPRAADAAAAGSSTHLTAPWPYTIVRPNIPPGLINADALMIHGIVNKAGRFESLAVAFPPQFDQADFVLSTLRQWEFRPATQDGRNAAVEVLLIIPDIEE